MKVAIAGGTGSLGRRLADDFASPGDDVTILTRSPRPDIHRWQVRWDGRTARPWPAELEGAIEIDLAGELVDRRSRAKNVELLRRSRVEPTEALVEEAVWQSAWTCFIYRCPTDLVASQASDHRRKAP